MSQLTRLPANLPDLFTKAGVPDVVGLGDWRARGRPASTGGFAPVGCLWHHTGGTPDDKKYAEWMAYKGRDDLPAPLAQGGINRKGTVFLLAGGRANHAGAARAAGSVRAGDGNSMYVGWECMNTGSEGWPDLQYRTMIIVGAVMMDVLETSVRAQNGHRETSVTGKWDPGMLDLDDFRDDVEDKNDELNRKTPAPRPRPRAENLLTATDLFLRRLDQAETKGGRNLQSLIKGDPDLEAAVRKLRRGVRTLIGDGQ